MKILVIGGGGREHALVWKLAGDSRRPQIFCAPGNAGTLRMATPVKIAADDTDGLLAWAQVQRPDLTVVGPEVPLCAGLTDRFEAAGLRVFGPSRAAAQLEGSKVFSKDVMLAGGVPTARADLFTSYEPAAAFVRKVGAPIVIKAEGLAAGKGVTVCATIEEADFALREALVQHAFGEAGARVLVEECLQGEEVSVLALVDGEHVVLLDSAQDHKRIFDHDAGPNTGGMGAYSPAPVFTGEWRTWVLDEVFGRTLTELRRRKIVYKGVLYAGLMMTATGPKVLEFNVRFGDPETQAILPRIEGDLLPALEACLDGTLTTAHLRWKPGACVCVVMAAGGYPGEYRKGLPITGLDVAENVPGVTVFHAGTSNHDGRVLTAGGRVLGVTALGDNLAQAVDQAYAAVGKITFDGASYRRDIAARALIR
ncbi:MAG: phosphoribosylamine--glycine ligase [bacterium]